MQQSLPFESPTARRSDPFTSHVAAQDAKLNASPGRLKALSLLAEGPKTDFELADASHMQQTSIGKRRWECMKAGMVAPLEVNGVVVTRPAPSGSKAIVWRITNKGRLFLESDKSKS